MRLFILTTALIISTVTVSAQKDTLIHKLDSLQKKTDQPGEQASLNKTDPSDYNENTKITFKNYFSLLASDVKQSFLKPFHIKSRDWKYIGLFAATEVGLSFADKPLQREVLEMRKTHPGINNVSSYVTNFGGDYEAYILGGLGAYGFIFKNEKVKTTTLLASQAYITGAALESVMKFITGRERPYTVNPDLVEANPTFHGPGYKGVKDANGRNLQSSFPSGHATVAFAAATVFAIEYKHHPWVPILTYSAATLIGISRITENKHWVTDVLAGAALGYMTGRQVANNYHRYAAIQNAKQKKGTVSMNLQYNFGTIQPGIVYHFR